MRKVIFFTIILSLLVGCASTMTKHREQIRNGLLTTGLNREAFLKEWGMPDKTYTISSDEFSQFMGGAAGSIGSATYFKGKVPLDVWVYESRQVTLIFKGIVLVGWKTEKTRKELESPQH